MTENQPEDPILRSRERARSLANLGKRCGYGCFGAAVIVFLFHYYIEGSSVLTSITVALLIIGSLILAPAIIWATPLMQRTAKTRGYHMVISLQTLNRL